MKPRIFRIGLLLQFAAALCWWSASAQGTNATAVGWGSTFSGEGTGSGSSNDLVVITAGGSHNLDLLADRDHPAPTG